MTAVPNPIELSSTLTAAHGFYAFRTIECLDDLTHVKDELKVAFGAAVQILKQPAPEYRVGSRLTMLSRADAARLLRIAHRNGARPGKINANEVIQELNDGTHLPLALPTNALAHKFNVAPGSPNGGPGVVSLKFHFAETNTDPITISSYIMQGALADNPPQLRTPDIPIAVLHDDRVADEIRDSVYTKPVVIPLSGIQFSH